MFGFVLPSFANYSDVWDQITSMDPAWLALLGVEHCVHRLRGRGLRGDAHLALGFGDFKLGHVGL